MPKYQRKNFFLSCANFYTHLEDNYKTEPTNVLAKYLKVV